MTRVVTNFPSVSVRREVVAQQFPPAVFPATIVLAVPDLFDEDMR
jgi:hypothetical protein